MVLAAITDRLSQLVDPLTIQVVKSNDRTSTLHATTLELLGDKASQLLSPGLSPVGSQLNLKNSTFSSSTPINNRLLANSKFVPNENGVSLAPPLVPTLSTYKK